MTSWFFSQETVRPTVDDEAALLRRIHNDLRLDLSTEATVFFEQNELDVVALGSGPGDFISCAEPGNAATDNNDPFHMDSPPLQYFVPCLPSRQVSGQRGYINFRICSSTIAERASINFSEKLREVVRFNFIPKDFAFSR